MKLRQDVVLRQVAGNWIVLPLAGVKLDSADMLNLNDTGAMLWNVLKNDPRPEALVAALTAEYDVSIQQAQADVDAFLQKLIAAGCMEEKEDTV